MYMYNKQATKTIHDLGKKKQKKQLQHFSPNLKYYKISITWRHCLSKELYALPDGYGQFQKQNEKVSK